MKKVLVLGAGGFVGVHLSKAINDHPDYNLVAVDITADKLTENAPNVAMLTYDIQREKEEYVRLISESDIIINLIAIANPSIYVSDPLQTFQLDFLDNLFVVEQCVKLGKRLIQFSTSEVYGKSASVYNPDQEYEFDEESSDLILGPINKHRWIYSCSKQLLERVIHAYGIQQNLNYTIIRPFNYIGPMIDFLPTHEEGLPRVFSMFMDALLYDKPMYMVDGGSQKRSYTDIRDATRAHMIILETEDERTHQQIINVGQRQNEISIQELAARMNFIWEQQYGGTAATLKSISGDEFYGKGYEDSDRRIPNATKMEKLGWQVEYGVDGILQHAMDYYHNKFSES